MKFKNTYSERKAKPEFYKKIEGDDLTDQTQITSASIVEMAKRFGIDAIIARAEAMEVNDEFKDKMYGNDITKMFTDKAEMLNTKKKLTNIFEKIPARIRKEKFNDDVAEFIWAYTQNDEGKLTELNKIGIVSTTQLENVKEENKRKAIAAKEEQTRINFIKELEKNKGNMYENYKKTGSIMENSNNNTTTDN